MRKLLALLLAFTLLFSFNGCGQEQSGTQKLDLSSAEWDEIVEAARGTTVTFYGWGGDENRNNWLNTTVADYVKEHYDIALEPGAGGGPRVGRGLPLHLQRRQRRGLRRVPNNFSSFV